MPFPRWQGRCAFEERRRTVARNAFPSLAGQMRAREKASEGPLANTSTSLREGCPRQVSGTVQAGAGGLRPLPRARVCLSKLGARASERPPGPGPDSDLTRTLTRAARDLSRKRARCRRAGGCRQTGEVRRISRWRRRTRSVQGWVRRCASGASAARADSEHPRDSRRHSARRAGCGAVPPASRVASGRAQRVRRMPWSSGRDGSCPCRRPQKATRRKVLALCSACQR